MYSQTLKSFGTVRARVGYAFDQLMPYVTGGWAWGRSTLTAVSTDGPTSSSTNTRSLSGWAAGAGFEGAIDRHWSIKFEYLHLGFGTKTYNVMFDVPDFTIPGGNVNLNVNTIKVGLNYRVN